jgi:coenzyme F420-0:L-glutamate ligase/coenzyme F420-1:gamma-L-glutamate ligase
MWRFSINKDPSEDNVANANSSITLTAIPGLPAIREGDDLGSMLGDVLLAAKLEPQPGDVLIITHKIVSKAEGRVVALDHVQSSSAAIELAQKTEKDPALVELILSESKKIIRHRPGLIIAEHRLGMVMANAGIDQSNVGGGAGERRVLLLPRNPDQSSEMIARALQRRFQCDVAVIIADSVGRAWRNGIVGLAIGAFGLPALLDLRGRQDLDGRDLEVTQVGLADEIASAAELLMGEADEARPAVLMRGMAWEGEAQPASALIRSEAEDMFR